MERTAKDAHEASDYDEQLMRHNLDFADSLKGLKDLQEQLYSAAEYFELSYNNDGHKQLVIETFKEYTTKALVSTVDHLGSVASKLNGFLEEKVDEVSATKLRFSCIEQKFQTCRGFIDLSGISQQTLLLGTPKHHKRYIISAGKLVNATGLTDSIYSKSNILSPRDNLHKSKQAFQASKSQAFQASRSQSLPLPRRGTSRPSSTESSPNSSMFSFTTNTSDKDQGRRAVSPFRFSLKRSGSVVNQPMSPSSSTSNPRAPSEPRRSAITRVNPHRNSDMEMEMYAKKSKYLLKALLSINRSRKDGVPSRFRDES